MSSAAVNRRQFNIDDIFIACASARSLVGIIYCLIESKRHDKEHFVVARLPAERAHSKSSSLKRTNRANACG